MAASGNFSELDDLLDLVEMEDFLLFEGIDYQVTRGRSGTQLNLRECPRCGGRDWKVYLNAETGLGSCFHGACTDNPGFNKYSFISHLNGRRFKDTIESLKRYARTVGWRPKRPQSRPAAEVSTDVTLPESLPLPINGRTLRYLSDRGFGPEMAAYFGWRLCQDGFFSYELDGQAKRQDYSKRVIIPVHSIDGTLVTFQGRSIEANPNRKYLFPPGLAGAGRYLYNAHNAIGCREVVMGEGAFDVAAIKKAFDEDPTFGGIGAIGSFGKSLSMAESGSENDQLSDLKALRDGGLQELTMMWDGEESTVKAMVKVGMEIRRYGMKVRVALLPKDRDPNEVDPAVVRSAFLQATELNPLNAALILSKCAKY